MSFPSEVVGGVVEGLDTPLPTVGDVTGARATAQAWAAEWPHDPIAHSFVGLTARNAGDLEAGAIARVCEITERCDLESASG